MTERTRTRAIDVDSTTVTADPRITDEIRETVELLKRHNTQKNLFTREEKKAQDMLDQLMAKAGNGEAWDFMHQFNGDTLKTTYAMGTKETVDKMALLDKVALETFVECATVSKGAVEKHCGKNIQNMVISTEDGNWKASVKVMK